MAADQDQFTAIFGAAVPHDPGAGAALRRDPDAVSGSVAFPADGPFAGAWAFLRENVPAAAAAPAPAAATASAVSRSDAWSVLRDDHAAAAPVAPSGASPVPTIFPSAAPGAAPGAAPPAGTASAAAIPVVPHELAAAAPDAPAASPGAAPTVAIPTFIPGDLVLSVYGDGDGSGSYGDNQASPVVLEQVTTAGVAVNQYVLPQFASTNAAGTTEYAFSGEYGSSSEGALSLSADGRSLVIMGYGVNAATYNAGGAAVYGNAALAQSTSVPGGPYTAVPRVVADIGADGTVDTSTAVYDVFNTNNGRSAATVDGSSFFISGQGVKGDTTQGLFLVRDGAQSTTAIDTTTDTRTAVIYDGTLYVSRDSKQGGVGTKYTSNVSSYGGEPTGATGGTVLAGLSQGVTLTAAQENGVNNGSVGKTVDLSPENFFFANASTLYVADGGAPKGGGIGDGGLQKWTLGGDGTWSLDYTLSAGLNLVANSGTSGTTGLIGLTGSVSGDTVSLYATNATIGDLDQTYLFGITDRLSATAAPAGESFTALVAAAADTNIRGVAFAPELACFARGTRLLTAAGPVPVERLEPGASMVVERDGRRVLEPAIWIGRRRVDLGAHPEPELVRPVRLLPDALGDGVPCRTLRLSPDHAVRLDGALLPVRALLNGGSIAAERPDAVEYFHVELPSHGILFAEDAAVESFLDTGNRAQFAGPVSALHPVFGPGPAAPRAPLPVHADTAVLEALWHRLAARSAALGHPLPAAETSGDPALCLLLPDGTRLHPRPGSDAARPDFRLPRPVGPEGARVRLLSRATEPATIRPWLDDRRRLGIAVGGLRARLGERVLVIAPGSADPADGWWLPEAAGDASWCWTRGDAAILLPPGTRALELDLRATAEYRLPPGRAA